MHASIVHHYLLSKILWIFLSDLIDEINYSRCIKHRAFKVSHDILRTFLEQLSNSGSNWRVLSFKPLRGLAILFSRGYAKCMETIIVSGPNMQIPHSNRCKQIDMSTADRLMSIIRILPKHLYRLSKAMPRLWISPFSRGSFNAVSTYVTESKVFVKLKMQLWL